jgi:hypothetical protein
MLKDCHVTFGSPETGYMEIDGTGPNRHFNNYRRFLSLNELSSLPNPKKVIASAVHFVVTEGDTKRELTRAEFEDELQKVLSLI